MQDWQVDKERLCCSVAGANRSIHLLTHSLESESGLFETKVTIGVPEMTLATKADGWGGFIIGAKGEFNDYRDAAIYGKGIKAEISTNGQIFVGEALEGPNTETDMALQQLQTVKGVTLNLRATPSDTDDYKIVLMR